MEKDDECTRALAHQIFCRQTLLCPAETAMEGGGQRGSLFTRGRLNRGTHCHARLCVLNLMQVLKWRKKNKMRAWKEDPARLVKHCKSVFTALAWGCLVNPCQETGSPEGLAFAHSDTLQFLPALK